ncbi:hypothetical protein BOTBODRAFT_27080 [Botryobasidium botryosum FD-172 SS1]|uniref:CP-type G domain-containing protein n=1 Tax=Botryobasidium botryosum (strain FD-172 SS1) TaxID=930990 RepID=A0A067MZ93_BOTB1|nr:hypothetical protein BOTBODRAFT_27080 [Botryobasidium botryosum FD-172 SS1]
MGKIRKKTSKRRTTHQRTKISQKAAETRHKNKKQAKKNPQWKSRVKKDIGIPNSLPFKDEILAEIAQARTMATEEKERRRELQKAQAKAAKGGIVPPADDNEDDEERSSNAEEEEDTDGITTSGQVLSPGKKHPNAAPAKTDQVPLLFDPAYPDLGSVLDKVHVLLHVLDARDPLAFRNSIIESRADDTNQSNVFVLNKIDLVPRESAQSWSKHLRSAHPTFLFRSATAFLPPPEDHAKQAKGKQRANACDDAVGVDALVEYLAALAPGAQREELIVAVVGLPNSGKSSVINSLLKSASLPIYKPSTMKEKSATTTLRPQPVILKHGALTITLVDTPGYVLASPETESGSGSGGAAKWSQEDEETRAKDMLLRVRGKIEKAKMPEVAVSQIVGRANAEDLMLLYNLPAFQAGDATAFLTSHARSTGRLKKGEVPDLVESARSVLRDWRVGKFPYYTHPPASASAPTPSSAMSTPALAEIYERSDSVVLESIKTRKELRLAGDGIVRLTPGAVDSRTVVLVSLDTDRDEDEEMGEAVAEEDADGVDESDEDEDEGEEDDGASAEEPSASSEDEEPEDASDLEEAPAPSISTSKRKRTMSKSAPAPAPKKVAFATKKLGRTNSALKSKPGAGEPQTKPKSSIKSATVAPSSTKALKVGVNAQKTQAPVRASQQVRRIGNSKNAKGKPAPAGAGAEEAYDFKKFF